MISRRRSCLLLSLVAAAACDATSGQDKVYVVDPAHAPAVGPRRFRQTAEPVVIAGGRADSTLAWGAVIAAGPNGVYAFDWADQRVVGFDARGRLLGLFGREGAGPGEFRVVTDLQLDHEGRLHVLDVKNRRITVLTPNLEHVQDVPLPAQARHAQNILPLETGYLMYTIPSETAFVRIGPTGEIVRGHTMPGPLDENVSWVAREGFLVKDAASDVVVYAFKYGNGWLAFQNPALETVHRGRFLYDAPFPAVVQVREMAGYALRFESRAAPTIRGAAVDRGCLYVVANDVGSSSESVVDVFDARTAHYAHSYSLPYWIDRLAVTSGTLYALARDPYSMVIRADVGSDCDELLSSGSGRLSGSGQ